MDFVRDIEERCLNACPPMQQVLYDGWVIRLADGYTRRANSVSPIYLGHTDPEDKIAVCEGLYRERGLLPIFKMTPLNHPLQLDAILAARGYMPEAMKFIATGIEFWKVNPSPPLPLLREVVGGFSGGSKWLVLMVWA
jgi:hypothetical protein